MPKETTIQETQEEAQDPVSFSFLMGAPDDKLDLDNTPTEEELEKKAEEEFLSRKSFGGLGSVPEDEFKKSSEEPDEGGQGSDTEDTKEEDKPESDEEKKPKKKKKVSFQDTEDSDSAASPAPAPAPTPQQQPQESQAQAQAQQGRQQESQPSEEGYDFGITDEDRAFLDTLPEDAKETVGFWADAEVVDEKYAGFAKKQIDYLRKHEEKAQEFQDADPDTPLEENHKYIAWVKRNKPSIPQREVKRLELDIIAKEAELRAEQKFKPEIEELRQWRERQEFERENMPKLRQKAQGFSQQLMQSINGIEEAKEVFDHYNNALKENDGDTRKAMQAISERFPEETQILNNTFQVGNALAGELIQLRMGFKNPDPQGNQAHATLAKFIQERENAMINNPQMQQYRKRNGKDFAPAHVFRQMPPEQQEKHWTFTTDDLLMFINAESKNRAQAAIQQHKQRVQDYIKRYGNPETQAQEQQKQNKEKPEGDEPRHQGVDAPGSSQRQPGSGEEAKSTGSRLLHWDF